MFIKLVVTFGILALVTAFAGGSIPVKGQTFEIKLSQPAVVGGTALKAGDYKVTVTPTKVTFLVKKELVEIPAKIETGEREFDTNQVEYQEIGNQTKIKQIRLGGTKTRLIFN